jgi:hypothetical protein
VLAVGRSMTCSASPGRRRPNLLADSALRSVIAVGVRFRPVCDIQSVRKRSSKSNEAKLKRDFWRRCGWLPGNPFVLLCWAAARSAGTGSADGGWPDTDAAKHILFLMMLKGEGSCNDGNSSYS